jgi:hypothetical protein
MSKAADLVESMMALAFYLLRPGSPAREWL